MSNKVGLTKANVRCLELDGWDPLSNRQVSEYTMLNWQSKPTSLMHKAWFGSLFNMWL